MWITNLAVRRRVTILMVIGAMLLLGMTRLAKMPLEYFPSADIPIVSVYTIYPGAGPDEVEQRVTKPLEDAVAIVNGVDDLFSESQENVSTVTVRFDLETDLDVAAADVRDAVTRARAEFPDDVEDPIVYKIDLGAQPIISMAVTGNRSPRDLLTFVEDQVEPKLGGLNGVSSVSVTGGEVREIRVAAHGDRLEAVGLSVQQLAQMVSAENLNVPSGELKEGGRSFAIRAMGELESLDEIRRLRVPTPLAGIVYLEELADVVDTVADADTRTRLNGRSTVGIRIVKQSNANTVSVSEGVHETLAALGEELPEDIAFTIFYDSAEDTQEALRDVEEALILGALLAALVTYLFLHNFRAMVIVVLAIPTSIIATFLPIYFFGFTLNIMTLMALSLSVGILVDDSIVVIENIERHLKMGEEPAVAAINGRSEIGGAAVAITLVDVVVFVPVAFMGGVVGQFFYPFGITVTVATLLSLFMSFTLTPMLASWWFSRETAERQEARRRSLSAKLFAALDVPFALLERAYRRFLPVTLRRPWLSVFVGYAALVVVVALSLMSKRVAFEFMPAQATGQMSVMLEGAPGTRLEVMDEHLARIEQVVLDKARYPEVEDVSVTAGTQGGTFVGAGNTGGQYGVAIVMLKGKTERREAGERTDGEVVKALREDLVDLPSVDVKIARVTGHQGAAEAELSVLLQSPDQEALGAAGVALASRIKTAPGVLYPTLSSKPGRPEVRAQIDRVRAADVGFTAAEVAMALRTAYEGDTSSEYREEGDEYDLRVQLAEFDRARLEDVEQLFIGLSRTGQAVRLGDVADVYLSTGPSRIERVDRERSTTVSAFLAEGVKSSEGQDSVNQVIGEMEEAGELAGVEWQWTGDVERRDEEMGHMFEALLLAILLVYIITAALYAHVLQPLNVMLTVPMAFGGGVLALAVWGSSLSISSMIGMIMLMGLVGKNAILVVDYTNTLRARGQGVHEALMEAGPTRMRPIFMTTISTVMALLPTALALNEASEFRAPMAHVVIGGLVVSTILSLLIVPAFYVITSDITDLFGRCLRGLGDLLSRRPRAGNGES